MSWDVYLEDNAGSVDVEQHEEGGTYAVGGIKQAELNVTYNYGKHFSFDTLNGIKAKDTVQQLQKAIYDLGTVKSPDYWQPTEGNVGYTCEILLRWAEANPEAVWRVS